MKLDPFRWLARRTIWRAGRGSVLSGPFASMQYTRDSVGSAYDPKLLGTYEKELHPVIEALCREKFNVIVNIGAAEGYYAVGMALRVPEARIVAFESEVSGQQLLRRMAEVNKVEQRLDIRGWCDATALQQSLAGATESCVIVDVEGEEETLLQPRDVPELTRAHILVELHDYLRTGVSEAIRERFQGSHEIEKFEQHQRTISDLPMDIFLLRPWLVRAMNEKRPLRAQPMTWFYLRPKHAEQ